MKTLVSFIVLALSVAVTNAQGVVELDEARVDYTLFEEMSRRGNNFTVNIRENYPGEFLKDPVAFLEKNFDINEFVAFTQDHNYDSYHITLKNRKGVLKADYDRHGKLGKTSYKFKNVYLPYALTQQIYLDNKGWSLVKTVHIGKGNNGKIEKSFYRLTMKNGKEKKRLKIDTNPGTRTGIAISN